MQRQFAYRPRRRMGQDPIAVIVYGLGAIGLEIARGLVNRPGFQLVGIVDVDPAKVGRDLAELLGGAPPLGLTVRADADAVLRESRADAVLHATGSFYPDVYPQLVQIVEVGLPVVSSAEELAYPFLRYPDQAQALDDLARGRGVPVVGLGVNPGFVMDVLPLALSSVCREVKAVEVRRVVDASTRRGNLQRKIGASLPVEQFQEAAATGRFGHVGLVESVALVAEGLDWDLDTIEETLEPVLAEIPLATEHVRVAAGQVAGIHQRAVGRWQGRERIGLDLTMAVGQADPHDAVTISGDPSLKVRLDGGVSGDAATVGSLINAVPRVLAAGSGLLTALDLPLHAGGFPTATASGGKRPVGARVLRSARLPEEGGTP